MDLKKSAAKIAERGRFGDDRLVHMSASEVEGLASLMPGGRLPTNPDTGLPEAFFFLPFLAALGGAAAAPAAAAGLGAAAAGAGTAAAAGGLAAGMGAAGLGAAGTAAAAAPAVAGLGAGAGLAGTGAASGLAGLGAAAAPTTLASALPAAGGLGVDAMTTGAIGAGTTAPSLAAVPAASLGTGTFNAALPSAVGNSVTGFGAGAASPAAIVAPTHLGGVPLANAATGAGVNTAAAPVTSAGGAGGVSVAGQGSLLTPLASGAEATKSGLGSLFSGLGNMDMGKMLQYGALASMMMPKGSGGGSKEEKSDKKTPTKSYDRGDAVGPDDGGSSGGLTDEWDYFPNARYYSGGGLVKGYADGGLASLDAGSGQPSAEEAGGSDQQLVQATVAAIQGQIPDPTPILQAFVQAFGQAALRDLISKVSGGMGKDAAPVQGQGDGMSDSIPASVEGQEPARLSEGEYVVPADVVSGIGNGSTGAGAKHLQDMVARTRQAKGGAPQQPASIDPSQVMPA